MADYRNILVVLEETGNGLLVDRAALLAEKSGARVTLLLAAYSGALEQSYLFNGKAKDRARKGFCRGKQKLLKPHVRAMESRDIPVETRVVWGKQLPAILDTAATGEFDLVIKGIRIHSVVQRTLTTHIDWQLIRKLTIPLWLVKNEIWPEQPRLVAAVDPVHCDDAAMAMDHRIMDHARGVAGILRGQLDILHVVDVHEAGMIAEFDTVIDSMEALHSATLKRHESALTSLLPELGQDNARVHLEEGHAEDVLRQWVQVHEVSLVVMGAITRSGLKRIFIGSTAEQVLDHLESDILIIK